MEYVIHILVLIAIYLILSVSLDLISGYTGQISLSHAAFFGMGAYSVGLVATGLSTDILVGLTCAILSGVVVGAIVGFPALRIRGDYVVIGTFCFQVIFYHVINNWETVTRGPIGIPGIPRPSFFGIMLSSHLSFLIVVAVMAAFVFLILSYIVKSPFGRVLRAIREDVVFALSLGKNTSAFIVIVYILGAGMAALSGGLFAYHMSFIDPTSFTVMESIFIISIVIIGGAGSLKGPALGAVILVLLPEFLRFLGLPSTISANIRQIIYGAALIGFMMWRPNGLLGKHTFLAGEETR